MREDLMVQQQVKSKWQHMVGVICLNQTYRKQVKDVLPKLFKRYPNAVTFIRGRVKTQERILIEVQAAENEYQLAVENYFTKKENLDLASRIEEKNQIKYFEGVTSSFELREAQLQLYSAQNNYIKAIQNVIQKKISLETLLNIPQQ